MVCLVVSSTALRAQMLAGLLSQCAPTAIAAACDSVEAAFAASDPGPPRVVILDCDGDSNACQRIARHLLSVSTAVRLILLSCGPCVEPLPEELAPWIDTPRSWPELLRCVRISLASCGELAELGDPLPHESCFARLRPRERAVLELVGLGLGSRDIGMSLGVSLQTVETYRKSVSAKLGVSGAKLVRIAVLYRCLSFGTGSPGQGPGGDGHAVPLACSALQKHALSGDGEASAVARV